MLYHWNGYFTLYAHLASLASSLSQGTTVEAGQKVGVMGGTGGFPIHLHFGVHRDNGNGIWNGSAIDKAVDPYGWQLEDADPWVAAGGPPSHWLWVYEPAANMTVEGTIGGTLASPDGTVSVTFPPGLYQGEFMAELAIEPAVAEPSAQLRSAGRSFWLRLLDWVENATNHSAVLSPLASDSIAITVTYSDESLDHLHEEQLALYVRNEDLEVWEKISSSSVDTTNNVISTLAMSPGHFDLQAPLLCENDTTEPDDSVYRSANLDFPPFRGH